MGKKSKTQTAPRPWIARLDNVRFFNEDGTSLYRHTWQPIQHREAPRAVVFIVPGMGDHCRRFDDFAALLSQQQMLVEAHDHIGHGRSEGNILRSEHLKLYARDVIAHAHLVKAKNPGVPMFIVGMSMGGGISVEVAAKEPSLFDGVVLCAPAIVADPATATPCKICCAKRLICCGCGCMGVGKLKPAFLSRNKEALAAWKADKLAFHGQVRAKFGVTLLGKLEEWQELSESITTPIYVLQSKGDRVVNPEGAQYVHDRVKSADKSIKWYKDAEHDLFHELPECTDEFVRDIITWINQHLDSPAPPLPAPAAAAPADEDEGAAEASVPSVYPELPKAASTVSAV